jgi:hypothetical protein
MIHIVGLLSPTGSYCRVKTVLERAYMAPYLCTVFGPYIRLIYWWGCLEDIERPHTLAVLRKKHSPRDFDSFRARTPESEQQLLPQLY